MATQLISLISEHLLPNYLLAKEMAGRYDRHVFITTKRMGEKSMTSRFCNTLNIEKKEVKIIIVSEDDLPDTMKKLESENFGKEDRFIVNITGGTKVMSIATFTHFGDYNADFYYIPIEVNKIENVKTGEDLPLHYRVNVEEYLSLYGLRFEFDNTRTDDNGHKFEEYVCNRICSEKGLKKGFVHRGVKLFRDISEQMNDNEIDVVWTADNQFFVGECKVSLTPPTGKNTRANPVEYIDQIMYKIAAISKDFGSRVNPYIFIKSTLNSRIFNPDRMKSINKRMKILGIKGLLTEKEFKQEKLNI
ncbi:MAG: DUF1887 family protein [Prevotellaceae bacterium]|nr:DUF1887 family protein [Prevotellaceae bacterium]